MRVIITGGCGFLGQCLARKILSRGALHCGADGASTAVTEVVLADIVAPASGFLCAELGGDARVRVRVGDVSDAAFVASLFDGAELVSCFHLSAIMSGGGEADFDLCVSVNLHGFLNVLEAARGCGAAAPRVVFSSTAATMGSGAPTDFIGSDDVIDDATRAVPHTTYGTTKSCCELLLNDYSRKGFVDGRCGRLPTVVVRAGAPNAATTSCFSGIVREPLSGVDCVMPIRGDVQHSIGSYTSVISSLLALHDVPKAKIESVLGFDRSVFLPAAALSLDDLHAALLRVVSPGSHHLLGKVSWEADEFLSSVISSFPTAVDWSRAKTLGIAPDVSADEMIRQYCADFAGSLAAGLELQPRVEADATVPEMIALITGGGSGIGEAVALAMAAEWGSGVGIVLCGRREGPLKAVAEKLAAVGATAFVKPTDLTRPQDVASLFDAIEERFGRLDLLFNNAGCGTPAVPMDELSAEQWQHVVDVNLSGVFHCTAKAMDIMKRQEPQGGRIINNGSISATTPRPHSAPYTATKHAVTGLTKSTALDGRRFNVCCGQIDIGNAKSAMTARQEAGATQANGAAMVEPTMDVADVARAVMYMANLPLTANVLSLTVMASSMPFVGRG